MFRHLQVGARSLLSAMFRVSLRQISQRTISSSSRRSLPNKVPEKQKLFQADNGLPVHLKAGTGDLLLYRLTMGITIFGAAYALYEIVMASFPKKQN